MTQHSIRLVKSAAKELKKTPKNIRVKIIEGLQLIATNPHSSLLQIKKLKGAENLYRFRVGDYRILYHVKKQELTVLVIKIGHRKDVYRSA